MQGKKNFAPQLFASINLLDMVPADNFYRKLLTELDLQFLYKATKTYYGKEGQESIDPVVFFKILLVGYLNNLSSDRQLIAFCSDSLSIRLFLGYDVHEALPWHSTISRTRQLFPEVVFEKCFTEVFKMCVEAGMVSGHTQAIDSAPVKANASMDILELKVPKEELSEHLKKIRHISKRDKDTPTRKAKNNKADDSQKTISANDKELQAIESRNKKWSEEQDQRPGAGNKGSCYTSNKTHYSPTDPDLPAGRQVPALV